MTPSFQSSPDPRSRFGRATICGRVVLLLAAIVLASAACSKLRSDSATNPGGGGHTTTADNSNTAASTGEGKPTTWEANATSLNGADGQTLTLSCSPGGTTHSVWGSDIYTSDSSICTAAVHSGLISFDRGGTVTVELRAGRSLYGASIRNGVTTSAYGPYQHSFVFKTANTEAVVREAEDSTPVLWNTSPSMVAFEVGKILKFKCPAGGEGSAVWGTDTYTLDSSLCSAAVHAGKIKLESGGPVTIEMRPGESSYKGSTRNGIKTNDYEKYDSSFIVK